MLVHLGSEPPHQLRLASPPRPLRLGGRGVEKSDDGRGRVEGRREGCRGGQEQGALAGNQARAVGRGEGGRAVEEDRRREGDVWYEREECSVGPALPPVTLNVVRTKQPRHEPTSPFSSHPLLPTIHFSFRLPLPFPPSLAALFSLHYVPRRRPCPDSSARRRPPSHPPRPTLFLPLLRRISRRTPSAAQCKSELRHDAYKRRAPLLSFAQSPSTSTGAR